MLVVGARVCVLMVGNASTIDLLLYVITVGGVPPFRLEWPPLQWLDKSNQERMVSRQETG